MSTEAWDRAGAAAAAAGVALRPLDRLEDSDPINHVIAATWGSQRIDREIVRALVVSGNVPWGACQGGEVVGFVLGWAGMDLEDGLHVHSHMLAAYPDRRHKGIGYALKLAQRAQALDQGIHLARWTFDPLIARNAWFNIGKLGAVCDRFHRGFYGEMRDLQNADDRSDRFMVRWDLDRPPSGPPSAAGSVVLDRRMGAVPDLPEPDLRLDALEAAASRVLARVPRDYQALRAADPALAARWREASAQTIEACLASGRRATTFTSDGAYVFT